MRPSLHPTRYRPAGRGALLVYVLGWALLGVVGAGLAIALLRDEDPEVALPPVKQTELAVAADRAGCLLRRGGRRPSAEPPVEGPRARPARAGTYQSEQPDGALVGAMRRGTIVIHYRPGLDDEDVEQLEQLQLGVPRATIVVPRPRMPYRLAVTGWRRLLGCQRLGGDAVDAIRLFRGRYVGQGPDSPRR